MVAVDVLEVIAVFLSKLNQFLWLLSPPLLFQKLAPA
jgi:hypothetical protein